MFKVMGVMLALSYSFMTIYTALFNESYVASGVEPDMHRYADAALLTFQLITGEAANNVQHNGVNAAPLDLVVAVQHMLFIVFNFGVSILVVDLVVATFLEYRGKELETEAKEKRRSHVLENLLIDAQHQHMSLRFHDEIHGLGGAFGC